MKSIIIIFTIILSLSAFSQDDNAIIKESYKLIINDKPLDIELDKESITELDQNKFKFLLTKKDVSKFIHGDLQFLFPSYMHYEFDPGNEGVNIRTLTGKSSLIMIQEYGIVEDLETILLENIKLEWAAMNAGIEVTNESIYVKDIKLQGTGLYITMGSIVIFQGIYIINSNNNLYALILQDTLDEKRNHTEEFGLLLEFLSDSFVF